MRNAITGYLGELDTAPRVGAWRRRRIRAEVSDHLAELIAEEREKGADPVAAAQRAAERFGTPAGLAAEFNADIARHGSNRASSVLAGCGAVAFVAAGFSPHASEVARPWPCVGVFNVVTQLWARIPIACGAIALFLAAVAPWLRGTPLGGRPAVLAGRSLTLASFLLLPVAVVAMGNLRTGMPLAERPPLAAISCTVPVAAIWGLRAASRASWLGHHDDEEGVLDVIAAAGEAVGARRPHAPNRRGSLAGSVRAGPVADELARPAPGRRGRPRADQELWASPRY